MQKADTLIRTKLRLPFARPDLVSRSRLQGRISQGLRGPLTLITAPAGFGKTTLAASCVASYGLPVAWLSLDKDDNQVQRFLIYLISALQETDHNIGSEAAQMLASAQQTLPEAVLTSLINDLDAASEEIVLVLDDYQFISSQAVHDGMSFLLEHCPKTFHLVIATRSDPPLPLTRLRGRGQMVEIRAADLRFTEHEAAQFLNEVMGLNLDAGSVAALAERTEGWIAGLQMASIAVQALLGQQSHLSIRDREDVRGFIEGFSGTNRYILDYLLDEVLASQPPEIQRFLLETSVLERLTAALCDAVIEMGESRLESSDGSRLSTLDSQSVLEYLEKSNLFLVSLDDERQWYRYHHLFADLLRTQLQKSIGAEGVEWLHLGAAAWYEENGFTLEAIQHASLASDDELVERLIKQNYLEMMNRGEMSWIRFWMGKLSRELVYRRPWLCLYEAMNYCWFGQLDEANVLLKEAEKRILAKSPAPSAQSMLSYHAYVKSRVTAMQGDTLKAIELCRSARENIPEDNLALQIDFSITLGYEYFLYGDFVNASKTLNETIQLGSITDAVNNPVAAYSILARLQAYQGRLHEAEYLLQKAAQLIQEPGEQNLGVFALVELGMAALLYERNDVETAHTRLKQALDYLPMWGKTDDLCLAYTLLWQIQLAMGNQAEAAGTIEKAAQLIQTWGVFSEARRAVEAAQVRMWLAGGDWPAIDGWAATLEKRFELHDPFRYEDELAHITQARVLIAQNKAEEAIRLLSQLEESARSAGRMGRVIEIMVLKALAMQKMGDSKQADIALRKSLALAEPEGYLRIFLDEGEPMRKLLALGPAQTEAGTLRDYAAYLLSQFEAEPQAVPSAQDGAIPTGDPAARSRQALVEPLTRREHEVLSLLAAGLSNRQIAAKLVLSEGTVKFYVHVVMEKLGVHSRTQAILIAQELNLI